MSRLLAVPQCGSVIKPMQLARAREAPKGANKSNTGETIRYLNDIHTADATKQKSTLNINT